MEKYRKKPRKNKKLYIFFKKFGNSKKFMYKNAIKIVWGVKNCAPFTKNMALFEEFFFATLCRFVKIFPS